MSMNPDMVDGVGVIGSIGAVDSVRVIDGLNVFEELLFVYDSSCSGCLNREGTRSYSDGHIYSRA
jgi:hypothetical protein